MGSTSTASGVGSSPVSACAAGVLLGVGCISIFVMGKLLQYVYEMGRRSAAAGGRGKLSATYNTSNPISENSRFSTWCICEPSLVTRVGSGG
jgi:hypothetical protein